MQVCNVPLVEIQPVDFLEFRDGFEQTEDFGGLVDSIRRFGLIQPIIIRPARHPGPNTKKSYELICGYRRCAAFRALGLDTIPAVMMSLDNREAFEVSLIENVQHDKLNPIEEAEAFKSYVINFGRGSVTKLAERIGKSEEYVSHRLLLLGLPKVLKERISRRLLNPSVATELVWLRDKQDQLTLSREVSKRHMSLRQVRAVTRLLRAERVHVGEAVARVLDGNRRQKHRNEQPESHEFDPWSLQSPSRDAQDDRSTAMLKRAKLLMRSALSGLDIIIEDADRLPQVHEILMRERNAVHQALDELIRNEIAYRKSGTILIAP
jgi:ParB/RepB/Spo0J family partition protein